MKFRLVCSMLTLLLAMATPHTTAEGPVIDNLVLVTLDGVRVEEMFGGLDAEALASSLEAGTHPADTTAYRRYHAPSREERRQKLMPFFWGTLMRQHGFIVGDPESACRERLANRHRSSYPGYSEILTGEAHDDVIDGNEVGQNPYPTVLELLRRRLDLRRTEVAVFASWATMRHIASHEPEAVFVDAGLAPDRADVRHDALTFELALAHLRTYRPRVLYISFDATDGLAHEGRYGEVLDALAQADRQLARLWRGIEADAVYRGRTALVVTVDHGRGRGRHFSDHGGAIEGAENVWTAYVVPGSPLRGVMTVPRTFGHDQLAATLARLLGVDYAAENPQAGRAIDLLFKG